jgi:predicted oxidoreductase
MKDNNYQADAIVVGGGIAGIITAYELLNHGKRVILLDRNIEAEFGGLARWAFGGMFFVDSTIQRRAGISDSIDLAMRDWWSFAEFDKKEYWGKKWAEQFIHLTTPHGYRWLREYGIRFFPVVHWVERGLFQPGNSVPRFHLLWGTGLELVRVFENRLREHTGKDRLQIHFRHRVTDLVADKGVVTGVWGVNEASGEAFTATGEATIIATGGINGSIERLKENWYKPWGETPKHILNGAHPYAIGDLHDATERINGNVVNLDKQWNYAAGVHHPKPRMPNHGLSLIPCKSALWVNYRGERFGPIPLIAAYDTRFLVERICQEEKKYSWQILNRRIAKKEFSISGSEHNTAVRDKKLFQFIKTILFGNKKLVREMIDTCEDFVVADSIKELAEKMNALTGDDDVDVQILKEAIGQFDANIGRGKKLHNDEQLRRIAHTRQYRGDRVRTCKFQQIDDPKARPLIAIREFILSRKSLGGIQTDLQCRVLTKPVDGQQEAIPGLYAVGEAAGFGGGGLHGLRALEGTFLSGCVITARVAAKAAVGKRLEG